jgi:hypothetical protein
MKLPFAPLCRAKQSPRQREEVMKEWSRAKLCDVVNFSLGTILFFLAPAVQPTYRSAPADRISHRTLDSGALDCCAGRLRGLGGMVQLGRRTVAHCNAMAVQLRGQQGHHRRRSDGHRSGSVGDVRDFAHDTPRTRRSDRWWQGSEALAHIIESV